MFGMLPFSRNDDTLFDLFDTFFPTAAPAAPAFRTDIRDQGDKFLLEAELPGFDKEEIQLDLKDNILTIRAQHKSEAEQKDENGTWLRRERRMGSFSRTFDVSGIDEDGITAAYQNGILALTLPKQQPVVPAARQIAIH
ncbi:MAG: Hsp20/alpha crystallin family protein [Ruminiclostridium sp.]|nr:Hsp20/alpha crystallin family protein [Ruminiclostridium sp.]